jgi:phosphatidylserine decarboxylase
VHAPWDGELVAARYVPGDLFSVNEATVARVDGLFRRNERLVMHFKTDRGPAVLILVGAMNVGSISTPWTGELRPRKHGVVDVPDLSVHSTTVIKGDLLGWFNMGSTVILLLPAGVAAWDDDLRPGETLRMGEAIGQLSDDLK